MYKSARGREPITVTRNKIGVTLEEEVDKGLVKDVLTKSLRTIWIVKSQL